MKTRLLRFLEKDGLSKLAIGVILIFGLKDSTKLTGDYVTMGLLVFFVTGVWAAKLWEDVR
jgi:hypothetical protein